MRNNKTPLIAIVANSLKIDGVICDTVRRRYIEALKHYDMASIIIPCAHSLTEDIFDCIDGVILTGSQSNINPHNYSDPAYGNQSFDEDRDLIAFNIIKSCVSNHIPLLGICRGLQEINVFFGGSLHQSLDKQQGFIEHQEDIALPRENQYSPTHKIILEEGGILRKIYDRDDILVNSLHSQGIKRLGNGLKVEGTSEDGLVEAISFGEFIIGVQWHPEWQYRSDKISSILWKKFREMCL